MNLLIVSHEYPPVGGGGANACKNLARQFADRGHEVTVITTWYAGLDALEHLENITVMRLKSRRKHLEHCGFDEMLDYLFKAYRQSKKLAGSRRFDLCFVFFAIPSGPIGYMLKRKYGLPYVIRFGGGDIPGFQNRFKLLYKLLGPAEKVIWKNADALVANSKGLQELAYGFYRDREVSIIPNGVDTKLFSPGKRSGDADFVILFVSRLIERKGLQDFIPQMPRIIEACGDRVVLRIVGDGPYRGTLEGLVDQYGLAGCVEFVGQVDKEHIARYYSEADVFILPSQREGMPNVVLEAMASGLPIVMTRCQGSDELVDDTNGFAVDVRQFAEKIIWLNRHPEERRAYGKASVRKAKDNFGWDSVASAYMEMFDEITEKNDGTHSIHVSDEN